MNKVRLEAFSDGVFAIAITLLVLNIAVSPTTRRLPEDLRHIWPQYLAYGMSFMIIGIIWAQHHTLFTIIRKTDHIFLLINIVFLMVIGFLPFPAHVLGDQLGKHNEQAAMSFYAGTFIIVAVAFNALWRYASWNRRLLSERADARLIQVTNRSYLFGPILYIVDFALSFASSVASLIFFLVLAVFYAVTPITVIARTRFLRPFTGLEPPDRNPPA